MLLDPSEKEFDLPAAAVQLGDRKGWQDEIVGQKGKGLGRFGILEPEATTAVGTPQGQKLMP